MNKNIVFSERVERMLIILFAALTLFVGVHFFSTLKAYRYIGVDSFAETSQISVTGEGEVFAAADIATFSFSLTESQPTTREAEQIVVEKSKDILDYLRGEGIEERDIKTTNYSIQPQYRAVEGVFIPFDQREIVGYTVTQSMSIKVRDVAQAGEIISNVGNRGVRNLSGLSFVIDDEDVLKEQARDLAIRDARAKAERLARSLGVSIERVVGFYESSGGYYDYPVLRSASVVMGDSEMSSLAPELPIGENKVTVRVEVVFKIR